MAICLDLQRDTLLGPRGEDALALSHFAGFDFDGFETGSAGALGPSADN